MGLITKTQLSSIPAARTDGLRRRQIDVLTSQEDGTREVEDPVLLQRATDVGRLLFSEDRDLLSIARQRQATAHAFTGLVFAAQQGVSIGRCIEDLELIVHCATAQKVANQALFLPLS